MSQHAPTIRCAKCGTEWTPQQADAIDQEQHSRRCPVCEYEGASTSTVPCPNPLTIADLETQLMALMDRARASKLPLSDIIRVLHDELEFTAEQNDSDHMFVVTVIDLGEFPHTPVSRPHPERLEILDGHGVTG